MDWDGLGWIGIYKVENELVFSFQFSVFGKKRQDKSFNTIDPHAVYHPHPRNQILNPKTEN